MAASPCGTSTMSSPSTGTNGGDTRAKPKVQLDAAGNGGGRPSGAAARAVVDEVARAKKQLDKCLDGKV